MVESSAFTLTTAKKTQLVEEILLSPNVSYTTEGAKMSDDLCARAGGTPHECWPRIQQALKLRSDLKGEPLEEPSDTWYTDRCCYKNPAGENVGHRTDLGRWGLDDPTKRARDHPPLGSTS